MHGGQAGSRLTAPKEPIWKLGMKKVGPSFTDLRKAAMRWPASCITLMPSTEVKMGAAEAK
jgi:hypothetical protein